MTVSERFGVRKSVGDAPRDPGDGPSLKTLISYRGT
jgi:hypothetical protein